MVHALAPLPYAYDALEPYIDAKTMEIHYSKHHQTYVDKLNAAVAGTEWEETWLDELLQSVVLLPKDKQTAVKNHGGGHWNHTFFWASMTAEGKAMPANLEQAITKQFGSVETFKEQFAQSALNNFWSGWTWLILEHDELSIVNTPNQNNPLMDHKKAILWLDVWEHAYYLKHQNKRADYINDRWHVVDRTKVAERFGSI